MAFELLEVVVITEEPAVRREHARAFLGLDHFARHGPELEPKVIDLRPGRTAKQVVDATVKGEPFAFPCTAMTARNAVHLEDLRLEAAHPAVNARGEPAHAG